MQWDGWVSLTHFFSFSFGGPETGTERASRLSRSASPMHSFLDLKVEGFQMPQCTHTSTTLKKLLNHKKSKS
jgi:hypothetical protein